MLKSTMNRSYYVPLIASVISLCVCVVVTGAKNPPQDSNQAANQFKQMCEKLCSAPHPCPPECYDIIDPWAMDINSFNVKKRSSGIDGFTFDDYLFLRWLGRDMAKHRLQK